jgi:mannose-6-phosphate isomerase-like protein (cupin superfamily)
MDGYTIGAPRMTHAPPHNGEIHPDGDEVLLLISGAVTVVLEDAFPPREVAPLPDESLIVPRVVWYKVQIDAPSQPLHITPGPNGSFRTPQSSDGA